MELDELRKVWKQQNADQELDYSRAELLMLINNKMISFEKDIKARDRREIIACVIVIMAFASMFFVFHSAFIKIGCAVIVLSAFFVWYKLKAAQKELLENEPDYELSMKEHLNREFKAIKIQQKLLRNIASWYILPICAGLLLFTIGTSWYFLIKGVYMSFVVIMGGTIWYLNQKAVSKRLDPLINDIRHALKFIEPTQE